MQHKKTIKQMSREASEFIEEAWIKSKQIYKLAGAAPWILPLQ